MRWQQRVRVATGLSCWQIVLHLLVVALLVMGWMSGTLVRVGLGLCVVYGVTVLLMLALQRHHEQRWRDVADVLEELTTTWYFGAAMIVLWLLSRVLQNNVLLALAGGGEPSPVVNASLGGVWCPWPAPPWSRCWRKTKSYITLRRNIAYAAEPVVAAITNSGHKLPQTICRLASFR